MPAPWRIRDHGGGVFRIGFHRINGADEIPVHDFRHTAVKKVFIKRLHEADFTVETLFINMLFAVPNRFVQRFASFSTSGGVGMSAIV